MTTSILPQPGGDCRRGHITGNFDKSLKPLNGNSACAFFGINDMPDGLWIPINAVLVQVDPGGHTQSC